MPFSNFRLRFSRCSFWKFGKRAKTKIDSMYIGIELKVVGFSASAYFQLESEARISKNFLRTGTVGWNKFWSRISILMMKLRFWPTRVPSSTNVWVKKTKTNRSSVSLLRFVSFFWLRRYVALIGLLEMKYQLIGTSLLIFERANCNYDHCHILDFIKYLVSSVSFLDF